MSDISLSTHKPPEFNGLSITLLIMVNGELFVCVFSSAFVFVCVWFTVSEMVDFSTKSATDPLC